jgi:hypothetical protein
MYSPISSQKKFTGKSLLLLGVYLLHFMLFQSVVAGLSGSNLFSSKSFFTNSHKSNTPNSGIATFRTLEKHELSQQTFKLSPDFSPSIAKLFNIPLFIDEPLTQASIPVSFRFSDVSYRLYVRDRAFRI